MVQKQPETPLKGTGVAVLWENSTATGDSRLGPETCSLPIFLLAQADLVGHYHKTVGC